MDTRNNRPRTADTSGNVPLPPSDIRGSYFERTGKLGPKIDVYFKINGHKRHLVYKHSTCWHRTCREAVAEAARSYGLPIESLCAFRDRSAR